MSATQSQPSKTYPSKGMVVPRVFSKSGVSPYDEIEWEKRTATIKDEKGKVIFEQRDCEIPKSWSPLATNVVVSKYFYGEIGTPERETSVRQLIERVVATISNMGRASGYFASEFDVMAFRDELTWLCLNQYGSFNSPVWFNVGLFHEYAIDGPANNWRWDKKTQAVVPATTAYQYPQSSACFIQSVADDMKGIMELATSEAMLFKFGSGTGTDLSTLRSTRDKLSGGGRPSGPVSFMRVYDSIASVIKSGGKTRRAAKMQTLKVWHPDVMDFIQCKSREERKAHSLIAQGYDSNFNGDAYSSILFQNANLSVRVTDWFLSLVDDGGDWQTKTVLTGETAETMPARKVMDAICEGTWLCGDPGVQYEDTIQAWHTCPNTAPINSSNPCSEFMFIDDSSCNLASLNLMKFRREDGSFDVGRFRAACRIFITAQEILVDHSSYPTEKIAENSHKFRPLGLGYANLGALLMSNGLAYDSDEGRALAACITAIMHGQAYLTSSEHAANLGPFDGFETNREPMLKVIDKHFNALDYIRYLDSMSDLVMAAREVCYDALDSGHKHGFRNSQVTVLAPTGTIAFMMDCDTTGIEPDIALVKYKSLAGGGMLKIVNQTVPMALGKLGYDDDTISDILAYIDVNDTIEGAPGLKDEHLSVFDCAFPPPQGGRTIHYRGHIRMMAAVQPFLSGAISKTCNVPNEATVEEIKETYMEGWRLGLKALAIYRDGSKGSQPVNTKAEKGEDAPAVEPSMTASPVVAVEKPKRERLPLTRRSLTHKFNVGNHGGYVTVGFYDDGRPGEVFITMAKEGSTVGGLMDVVGTSISIGLQYGVPLDVFVDKFAHTRFEPSGMTKNPDIPFAKSVADYIARWLGMEFIPGYREEHAPRRDGETFAVPASPVAIGPTVEWNAQQFNPMPSSVLHPTGSGKTFSPFAHFQSDAPACDSCGSLTVRCGTCYRCFNCGNSMGCS